MCAGTEQRIAPAYYTLVSSRRFTCAVRRLNYVVNPEESRLSQAIAIGLHGLSSLGVILNAQ
jgi:hypothetical protein